MKLREPYYVEDMGLNQPYLSMLLISPFCDFSCKNCINKHLQENIVQNFNLMSLSNAFEDNPFFQGLTIAGLEPFLSGIPFLSEIKKFIEFNEIEKITLYTRFNIGDLFVKSYLDIIKNINTVKDFYVKTGNYVENKNSKIIYLDNWGIELASDNQNFIKYK